MSRSSAPRSALRALGLDGALMSPGTKWYTKVALVSYSQAAPPRPWRWPRRRRTLGETIRFMVTTSYPIITAPASFIAKQLKTRASSSTSTSSTGSPWSRRGPSPGCGTCSTPPTASSRPDPVHLHESDLSRLVGLVRPSSSTRRSSPPVRIPPSVLRSWRSSRPSSIKRFRCCARATPSPTISTARRLQGIAPSTMLNFPSFWNVSKSRSSDPPGPGSSCPAGGRRPRRPPGLGDSRISSPPRRPGPSHGRPHAPVSSEVHRSAWCPPSCWRPCWSSPSCT